MLNYKYQILLVGIITASTFSFADEVMERLINIKRDFLVVAPYPDPGQILQAHLAKEYKDICVLAGESAMDARADLRLQWGYREFADFGMEFGRRYLDMAQICKEISGELEKQTIDQEALIKLTDALYLFYSFSFIPAVSYSSRLKSGWDPTDQFSDWFPSAALEDQLSTSRVLYKINPIVYNFVGDRLNFVNEVMRRMRGYLKGHYLLSWQNAESSIFKTQPGQGWPVHLANAIEDSGTGRSGHLEAAELIVRDLAMELFRQMIEKRIASQWQMDDQEEALTVRNTVSNFAFAYAT